MHSAYCQQLVELTIIAHRVARYEATPETREATETQLEDWVDDLVQAADVMHSLVHRPQVTTEAIKWGKTTPRPSDYYLPSSFMLQAWLESVPKESRPIVSQRVESAHPHNHSTAQHSPRARLANPALLMGVLAVRV